jgi:hypothetical protein
MWYFIIGIAIILTGYANYRANRHKLGEENGVRDSLGLPSLTASQFNAELPEYAGNFRCNINQHQ